MYTVKGFVTINSQIDNDPNVVAALGELSGTSRTFSKDQKVYRDKVNHPDVGVALFSAKDQDGTFFEPTSSQSDHILEIAQWAQEAAKAGTITLEPETFHDAVTAEQAAIAANLSYGDMLGDGGIVLPEYMEWSYLGVTYKLWFADEAFQVQYDEYEFSFVNPIEVLNDLQRPYSEIHELIITELTPQIRKANEITAEAPYTILEPFDVEWIDRATGTSRFITWLIAIYGPGGQNPVSIREGLKQYILDNSDFNAIEWNDVLPELFKPTEFIIIPQWDRLSIPDTQAVEGIYRPMTRYKDMVEQTMMFSNRYTREHIEEYLIHTANIYKSLGFLAIGNDGNNDGIYSLDEKFPDYNLVNNMELDFNRLSAYTQEWMKRLHKMLTIAEVMADETVLPEGYTRLRRAGVTFCVTNYDGVSYLVVTKESHEILWTQRDPSPDEELV